MRRANLSLTPQATPRSDRIATPYRDAIATPLSRSRAHLIAAVICPTQTAMKRQGLRWRLIDMTKSMPSFAPNVADLKRRPLLARLKRIVMTPLAATTTIALGAACASTPPRSNVSEDLETPAYVELERSGEFEIRRVDPYIVAATTVDAMTLDEASRDGFRILANYIFGNNTKKQSVAMTAPVSTTPSDENQKIAMTAPVSTKPVANEKIAMTAPVATTPTAKEEATDDGTKAWDITFMMPSEYTLETLPEPKDSRVRFEQREASCQAAVVFAGFTTDATVEEKTAALRTWLAEKNIEVAAEETLARYNDPFTLPWNRRNEVVVDLTQAACKTLMSKRAQNNADKAA